MLVLRNIRVTPRIGITRAADWPLRFHLSDDTHVSPMRAHAPRRVPQPATL